MKLGADGVILTDDKAKLLTSYLVFSLLSENVLELENVLC